jgi:PAT family beta-lactamase induction signal transducer AmpG
MRLPDLLASKWGRMTVFFFLYMTEGIPLGFTATAVATEMRRPGLGPAEVGAFVGSLYLPWAFKWIFGPFVDVLSSERLGRRRMWIVLAQVLMVGTLLAALPVSFTTQLRLFTILILIHNVFGATQDVAIDALACSVLKEHERGLANGLMFGGAYLGQAVGGSGVLFLTGYVSFKATFFFVAAWILSITILVALPLRERRSASTDEAPRPGERGGARMGEVPAGAGMTRTDTGAVSAPGLPGAESGMTRAGREIAAFVVDSFRAFTGTRAAAVGVLFALLPAGAYALGLALQSNLAVELGMDNSQIGWLNLWSTIVSAGACILGGFLSDRFGRRKMLALYTASMSVPTLYMAAVLQKHGWIMPIDPQAAGRPVAPQALIIAFWAATLVYSLFNGLMYGTRTALFMDITTPAVAATQFTAYMAMLNLVIAYSARWQGVAVERWGYPLTFVADALFGLVAIALLPLMAPVKASSGPLTGMAVSGPGPPDREPA